MFIMQSRHNNMASDFLILFKYIVFYLYKYNICIYICD